MTKVRTKPTPGEKEEAHKKKTTSKKKAETGSWPCKINGCNKVFAREADLKRHQRTTKLHSQPGFACPQCDATFTRTDALRRHQKSRHNGVIMEPTEQEKDKRGMDGETGSSGSKSPGSRDGTPSRREGDYASYDTPPSALAQPGTAGPSSGPSSYYRQHTMTAGYPPRPPPGMIIDPHYQPIGIPTSATRMHQSWPPPWPTGPDGHPLPPNAVYMPPPYYQPSPYYRHPGTMIPPHMPPHPHGPPYPLPGSEYMPQLPPPQNGVAAPHIPVDSPSPQRPIQNAPINGNHTENKPEVQPQPQEETAPRRAGSAPVIDPSLDKPSTAAGAAQGEPDAGQIPDNSLETARAAVEAVLKYEKERTSRQASLAPESQNSGASPYVEEQLMDGASTEVDREVDEERSVSAGVVVEDEIVGAESASQAEVQPQMEQLLTEDGEPMLNPAELLTQESLASPPP